MPSCVVHDTEKQKKVTYIKYGNACQELDHCRTSGTVTGGHNYYVYATATELRAQILYLSVNKKKEKTRVWGHTAKNIPFFQPVDGPIGKAFGIIFSELLILFELIRFNPDHIHCVRTYGTALYYLFAKIRKTGFTMVIHTDLNYGRWWSKKLERHVFKRADSLVCHGPFLAGQARKLVNHPEKVLEYNASTKDIVNMPIKSKTPEILPPMDEETRLITYVGRMETDKGITDLYEAFKRFLETTRSKYSLCFAGSGEALSEFKNKIEHQGWHDRVYLMGKIPRKEVPGLLSRTWVMVTPTRVEFPEGRCMSAMEALSLGVPVIAPKFGPFEYLIKDGKNGFFYQPNSVSDLSLQFKKMDEASTRQRLVTGALRDGKAFINPPLSYSKAMQQSLEMARRRLMG